MTDDDPPYPTHPKKASILTRLPIDLTMDELKRLPETKATYEAEMIAYKEAKSTYGAAQDKKVSDLRDQCESEFDMKGHPKADLLWSKAWDKGHSSGLQEVYSHYVDLVELVK